MGIVTRYIELRWRGGHEYYMHTHSWHASNPSCNSKNHNIKHGYFGFSTTNMFEQVI
jgi:hypothetical protein